MTKYYVRSGQLECITIAASPLKAACNALSLCNNETLDYFFYIDERGFRGPTPDCNVIDSRFLPKHTIKGQDVYITRGDDEDSENLY